MIKTVLYILVDAIGQRYKLHAPPTTPVCELRRLGTEKYDQIMVEVIDEIREPGVQYQEKLDGYIYSKQENELAARKKYNRHKPAKVVKRLDEIQAHRFLNTIKVPCGGRKRVRK